MQKTWRMRILRTTALAGLALGGLTGPALAQEAEEEEDRIVVTGSRLAVGSNFTSAAPVLSVTDEEIDIRGTVRIEDLINILPQVFANQAGEVSNGASGTAALDLRGVGPERTLVLIDGRRVPYGSSQFAPANLDLIPAQLIEKVDILTGGASAVYGSDAVGGVANFILKRDFEGIELDVLGGIAQNSNGVEPFDSVLRAAQQPVPDGTFDGEEITVSLTLGANTADGRGNVTLFGTYTNQEAIVQADRSISACTLGSGDTSGFGCVGSANFRLFGGPGGFAFQEENGEIVPFVGGPEQTFNFGAQNFFQRPAERYQIYVQGHYELTDNIEAFADLSFNSSFSDAQIAPTASFGIGSYSINCDNPLIQDNAGISFADIFGCNTPDANGALPAVVDGITASHRNVEGGPRNSFLENNTLRMVGGFRGTLFDQFEFETFAQFSRTRDIQEGTNDFITTNLQQAFFAVEDENGNVVCQDPTGGCVPYNIFQRGPNGESLVTQESLDFIEGVGIVNGTTDQIVAGGTIQTNLENYGVSSPFSSEGVGVLLGVEYRQDNLFRQPDQIFQVPGGGFTGLGGATLPVEGQVEVFELFGETAIPLAEDLPLINSLSLQGQYRFSDYSTDGNDTENSFDTNTFGVQLSYKPVEDFLFRAQFQRAVRAPNVIELFTGVDTGLPNLDEAGLNANGVGLFDPCASDAPLRSFEECARTGVTAEDFGNILDVIAGQTQSITGGNPDLDPETSDTITIGGVFTPSAIQGLSVSIDYFNISIEDFINDGVAAQVTLNQCLDTGNPQFCDLITRGPGGTLAAGTFGVGFNQLNINIAELETSGLDFQILYGIEPEDFGVPIPGSLRFDYAATYLQAFDFTPFPGAEAIECAGQFGNACENPVNPRYRHRLLTTWVTPFNAQATATWRYLSGTENINDAAPANDASIDAFNYLDLSFNYDVRDGVRLRGGALNVLNNQAPVSVSAGPPLGNGNTFPTIFDTGRFIFLGVTLSR